jgi:hypothetical protein
MMEDHPMGYRCYRIFRRSFWLFLAFFGAQRGLADLPLSKLPQGIQELAREPNESLEELFRSGTAPQGLPEGRALGYHRVDADKRDRAPIVHYVAVKTIWQAKSFQKIDDTVFMTDDTILPNNLEPLKAHVSFASTRSVFEQRYAADNAELPDEALDSEPSLVTDYYTWKYPPMLAGLMSPFKHWFDEYRIVDPSRPQLLLGRSYYAGRFWGWLFIEFDQSNP